MAFDRCCWRKVWFVDMEKDLISIIVPVYNVETYLGRCMESILKQTYKCLEIILVDDGSTDSSGKMCDEYAKTDSRVKVIHKTNGGLSDARNAGLEIATGEYIGYVDSDDWIEPQMYECMYNACVENKAELAVCRYFSEYKDRTESGGTDSIVPLTQDKLLDIYIRGNDKYIIYNSVWSKLFKRELVEDMIFPKGRNSEDIMYTTKSFCRLNRAVYIDRCLYHYVLDREGSIMNVSRGERMFRDEIPFWREHISYIRELVSDVMADLALYYFQRRLLFYYIDAKNSKNQEIAQKLIEEIKVDQKEADRVYASGIATKGDRVRRRLFFISPNLYAQVVGLYEKFIIPLRQRG